MPQYSQSQMKDRLINYLPELYYDIIDIDELIDTESYEMSTLWEKVQDSFLETFTQYMTSIGVSRWESILNITTNPSSTLEQRREIIRSKLYNKNKASFIFLETILAEYGTVESITFDNATSTVILRVATTQILTTQIYIKTRNIVPAHLLMEYIFTIASEGIGIKEEIYGAELTRTMSLGNGWHLGVTPFAEEGMEVQYK